MSDIEVDAEDTPQCEEIDCEKEAAVTLVNIRHGNENAYCVDHAEEALEKIETLNVGESL